MRKQNKAGSSSRQETQNTADETQKHESNNCK